MARMVHVETLVHPEKYSEAQLMLALRIQRILDRGKLILTEKPWGAKP